MSNYDDERVEFEKQFDQNDIVYDDSNFISVEELLRYRDEDFVNPLPSVNRFIRNEDEIEITPSGKLLRRYLEYYGPGCKNIELFNNWICKTFYNNIHDKIYKLNLDEGYELRFENPKIIPPCYIKNGIRIPLTPQYCRLNGKTYDVLAKCTLVLYKSDPKGSVRLEPSIPFEIGKIPIVVKSRVCTLYGKNEEELEKYGEDANDPGGYYIIKGKEKTIIFQEQMAFNKVYLFKMKEKICCRMNCLYAKNKTTTLFQLSVDDKKKMIDVEFTSIKRKGEDDKEGDNVTCNVVRILRVLGIARGIVRTSDGGTEIVRDKCKKEFRDVLMQFIPKEYVNACMNKFLANFAEAFIGYEGTEEEGYNNDISEIFKMIKVEDNKSFDKKEEFVLKKIDENILPQVRDIPPMNNEGVEEYKKRYNKYRTDTIVSMLANILLHISGFTNLTNRDSWANKKTEGTGRMQEPLFKSAFQAGIAEAAKILMQNKSDFTDATDKVNPLKLLNSFHQRYNHPEKNKKIKLSKVTKTFLDSFISPTWGVKGKDGGKTNVVQGLNRDSVVATFAHLDTIDVNIPRNTQQASFRKVQDDQYGGICSVSSSEGETCGLVKAFCITARMSLDRLDIPIIYENYIYKKNWLVPREKEGYKYKFCMNGVVMGWCDGDSMHSYLLNLRRTGIIPFDVALIKHTNVMGSWLHVDTSPSRVIRPLLIVKDGKLEIDNKGLRDAPIEELLVKGCMEYVSLWEQHYIKLASDKKVIDDLYNEIEKQKLYIEQDEELEKRLTKENPDSDEYIRLSDEISNLKDEKESELLLYEDNEKLIAKMKKEYDQRITAIEKQIGIIKKTNKNVEEIISLRNKLRDNRQLLKFLLDKEPYTHCEIDSLATLGIAASLIPMPNHCQAPRNTYQTSMAKQALANPHSNSINRFDGKTKRLAYPTRPYLETETSSILGLDKKGSGFMATLAFLAFPYTEEDAFIFKREFIQAGGSRMYKSITFVSSLMQPDPKKPTVTEKFMRPNNIKSDQLKRYTYIQENGLPCIGAPLEAKDCVIGKVRHISGTKTENQSTLLKLGEEGVVEKVYVNGDTVKVKIAITRIPVIGDKFSPRNAQKATIGYILDEKDMPFCEDTGITPDIITNPHQIPTRMTLSYPYELIASKSAGYHVKRINGTAFRFLDLAEYQRNLESRGLDKDGTQQMRSGITGKKFEIRTYIGPVFMQALKHHPMDKIQARSTGAKKAMTRQPQGGRNKNGGLRWGEMERDAAAAWGASSVVQERLCYVSDPYNMIFCRKCSEYGLSRLDLSYKCPICKEDHNTFGRKVIPWVATLLSRLMGAAGIRLQLDLEFSDETKNKLLKNPINTVDYNEIENLRSDDKQIERMSRIEDGREEDTSADDFVNTML